MHGFARAIKIAIAEQHDPLRIFLIVGPGGWRIELIPPDPILVEHGGMKIVSGLDGHPIRIGDHRQVRQAIRVSDRLP